ncbi:MAG: hypothetical protein DBO98_05495 [Candidatus Liberibacter europaeus]|nr:hypothetical protein [Candidatus Liberibacter europaeus]
MPNALFTKRSFAGGEYSPQIIQSRSDLELHARGLSQCFNMISLQDGSIVRRPPLRLYGNIKLPLQARRVISFALGDDKTALFVFGKKKMMFILVIGLRSPEVIKSYATPYNFHEAEQLYIARMGGDLFLVILCKIYR